MKDEKTDWMPNINWYYREENVAIACGDCLEVMKKIPDESIDLVLTDPPYNISHKGKIFRDYRSGKNGNINMDFGEWDYNFNITPFLEETKRILKKYGQWIVFCAEQQIGIYRIWLEENGHFKQIIIWEKTNPLPQFRKCGYRQTTEIIMWAYKNNPTKKEQHFNFLLQEEMKNIFRFPICGGKERTIHPTQKPIKLIEQLLLRHSFKNDLILDPFLGSGTTAVACKNLGRKCIGIEINKEYCDISIKRLRQEVLNFDE